MKHILNIIFVLGYICFVIAIFTSGYSTSKDFVLLGTLTTIYCPIAVSICKLDYLATD